MRNHSKVWFGLINSDRTNFPLYSGVNMHFGCFLISEPKISWNKQPIPIRGMYQKLLTVSYAIKSYSTVYSNFFKAVSINFNCGGHSLEPAVKANLAFFSGNPLRCLNMAQFSLSNLFPFICCLALWNIKKLEGFRSGEYSGWGINCTPNLNEVNISDDYVGGSIVVMQRAIMNSCSGTSIVQVLEYRRQTDV